jgi:YgiT-type zinc finger domain-containing protein
MEQGFTELILKRERSVVVIEAVPALVCPQCAESSIDVETAQKANELAEQAIKRGVPIEFHKFAA